MELSSLPMGEAELVASVGGLFVPWLINLIKQYSWGDTLRVIVAFVVVVLWTAVSMWISNELVFGEDVTLRSSVIAAFGVFFVAHLSYKTYWQNKTTMVNVEQTYQRRVKVNEHV